MQYHFHVIIARRAVLFVIALTRFSAEALPVALLELPAPLGVEIPGTPVYGNSGSGGTRAILKLGSHDKPRRRPIEHFKAPLAENSPGRILLYVTTSGSHQHHTYLECQADFLSKTETLRTADVLMYVGEDTPSSNDTRQMYSKLLDRWTSGRTSIHYDKNEAKQQGAMKAAHMGFSSGWFDGYDWVIRINPDVVIYDERNLVNLMREPRNNGIFVKCQPGQIHTDFFAVRPRSVERMAFSGWAHEENAERQAAEAFRHIIENASYAELLVRGGNFTKCRVDGGGVYHTTVNCPELLGAPPWMNNAIRHQLDMIYWREAWAQH